MYSREIGEWKGNIRRWQIELLDLLEIVSLYTRERVYIYILTYIPKTNLSVFDMSVGI